MTYVVMTEDGTQTEHDGVPSLETMQKAVGGYVEVKELDHGVDMWMHDEAKFLMDHRQNWRATVMSEGRLFAGDYVAGVVVFTSHDDEDDGATTGLNAEQLEYVRAATKLMAVGDAFTGRGQPVMVNVTGTPWANL